MQMNKEWVSYMLPLRLRNTRHAILENDELGEARACERLIRRRCKTELRSRNERCFDEEQLTSQWRTDALRGAARANLNTLFRNSYPACCFRHYAWCFVHVPATAQDCAEPPMNLGLEFLKGHSFAVDGDVAPVRLVFGRDAVAGDLAVVDVGHVEEGTVVDGEEEFDGVAAGAVAVDGYEVDVAV